MSNLDLGNQSFNAIRSEHLLCNDVLELRIETSEGRVGGVRLTGIRDIAANRVWLDGASPLFELSANGVTWPSDTGLIVDSVEQRGTQELTVHGRTSDSKLQLEFNLRMEPGNGLALVSGTIKNPGKDWFGPFLLGDLESAPVPVFPRDADIAVVPPRGGVEEILVSGFDGILYSAEATVKSEEHGDGAWSAPQPLQDPFVPAFRNRFPAGAPIATVRRNDHQGDAFAIDTQGQLITVFRLDGGRWSPPIRIAADGTRRFQRGGSVVALSVNEQADPPTAAEARPNEVAVFALSEDGIILRSHEVNDSPFSPAVPINSSSTDLSPSARLAAVKRNQSQQDLFVVDRLGRLLTTFHIQGATLWSDFIALSPPSPRLRSGSALAAVRGRGDDVHVFVVGQAENVDSPFGRVYETHETSDGAWTDLSPITPPIPNLAAGSAIAAVRRSGSEIDVMFVLGDGTIGLVTRELDGSWSNFSLLPATHSVQPNAKIAAVLRRPEQLDVFSIAGATGRLWTAADGLESLFLRTVFPKIRFLGGSSLTGAFGMIPQEIGTLTQLKRPVDDFNRLGMPYEKDMVANDIGLPEAMNALEVVNVARDGRSLFFVDLTGDVERGRAPIQFTLGPDEIDGFWVASLKGEHQISLPTFGIGVGDGDFRRAVDVYMSRNPSARGSVDTPSWLREAGAIYTSYGGGAGGIYLELPGQGRDLVNGYTVPAASSPRCHDVGANFQCTLRRMIDEANALGTNVIYLYDYWQAVDRPIQTCPNVLNGSHAQYFCKGDYFINRCLGDTAALRAAVAEVHAHVDSDNRKGRVILYLEPFAIHRNSAVGNAFGDLWGERAFAFRGDPLWRPFAPGDPNTIAMSQSNGEWQNYVVETARRLIKDTGADGIFLDSAGWRLNIPGRTKQEVVSNSPIEGAMAVLNLVDRIRAAVRSVNPEAVVLSETTSGPMWRHVDGGVSADFNPSGGAFTGASTLQGRLLTSPIRYGAPQINVFSNGTDLNQLNQVFATGHGLALCTNWDIKPNFIYENAQYIQTLVRARRTFASALVHGRQVAQQDLDGDAGTLAIAYSYAGNPDVVIVLNPTSNDFTGTVPVHGLVQAGTHWRDFISGDDKFIVTPLGMQMKVPKIGLRILEKLFSPSSFKVVEELQQRIREHAYFQWEAKGRELWRALDDWLEAERQILGEIRQTDSERGPDET